MTDITKPSSTQMSVTGTRPSGFIVGSTLLLNGIRHVIVHVESSDCVFHLNTYNESVDMGTIHIDSDCTTAKKTKRKGTRFKPTVADRLTQAKNSKYGRH